MARRDAEVREAARADAERLARQAAEAERAAAQAAANAARVERDNLAAELAGWTSGGPLARAWRTFTRRGT